MSTPRETTFSRIIVGVVFAALVAVLASQGVAWQDAEPAPPEGQTYTGAKRCASCHFEQFMSWSKTKHAKTFDLLTAKYEGDATCLKCHTTGYGEASGYKDASTASLAGTTCESCHGPGSAHETVAAEFAKTKELTPEQEASVRDSIWKSPPQNVCVGCHVVQGHKESPTPPEMRSE